MAEDRLKSALEIAMERLRQKDRDEGVELPSLTDEQKARIAEIRNFYEAKIAEQDVLLQSRLRGMIDPNARDVLEGEFRRERERLTSDKNSKIERIRRGESQGSS